MVNARYFVPQSSTQVDHHVLCIQKTPVQLRQMELRYRVQCVSTLSYIHSQFPCYNLYAYAHPQ